jgi:hypothetical protein
MSKQANNPATYQLLENPALLAVTYAAKLRRLPVAWGEQAA